MDKTESWEDTMTIIRDTNKVLLHRQENSKYIPVKDKSAVFTLEDYCIDENGKVEDMAWGCEHRNTSFDSTDLPFNTLEGVKTYEVVYQTCEDCGARYNEIDEEWIL